VSDLYVEQAGSGSPVVLIHEGIADSRMWEPQWRPYSERFRVVRLDLRGHPVESLVAIGELHRPLPGILSELSPVSRTEWRALVHVPHREIPDAQGLRVVVHPAEQLVGTRGGLRHRVLTRATVEGAHQPVQRLLGGIGALGAAVRGRLRWLEVDLLLAGRERRSDQREQDRADEGGEEHEAARPDRAGGSVRVVSRRAPRR